MDKGKGKVRMICCNAIVSRSKFLMQLSGSNTLYCKYCKEELSPEQLVEILDKESAAAVLEKQNSINKSMDLMREVTLFRLKEILLREQYISEEDTEKDITEIVTSNCTANRLISNFVPIVEYSNKCGAEEDTYRDVRWLSTKSFQAEYDSFCRNWGESGHSEYLDFGDAPSTDLLKGYAEIDREQYDRLLDELLKTDVHDRCYYCRTVIFIPKNCTEFVKCHECSAIMQVGTVKEFYDYQDA